MCHSFFQITSSRFKRATLNKSSSWKHIIRSTENSYFAYIALNKRFPHYHLAIMLFHVSLWHMVRCCCCISLNFRYHFVEISQVNRKLGEKAASTTSFTTNMGNKYGQVLKSVLTDSEEEGPANMISGLIWHYRDSKVTPPKALHVDRDCCLARLKPHFKDWGNLAVRLDIWHFTVTCPLPCLHVKVVCLCVWVGCWRPSRLYAAKTSQHRTSGVWSTKKEVSMFHHVSRFHHVFDC